MPDEQVAAAEPTGTVLTEGAVVDKPVEQPVTTTDWRTSIPEDIRKEKSLESFKDIGSLAKSYVEAQKMIGQTVRIPKEDAKPEEWSAFYKKIGVPENVEGYELELPDMPDGNKWSDETVTKIKAFAKEHNFTPTQAQAMVDYLWEKEEQEIEKSETQLTSDIENLQKQWGPTFKRRITLAQRAVKEIADPEIVKVLETTGLGNNPAMIRLFAKIGETLVEDGVISGEVYGADGPDAAKSKINQIGADKKHPLWDETSPGHKAAVEEWTKLHKLAFG